MLGSSNLLQHLSADISDQQTCVLDCPFKIILEGVNVNKKQFTLKSNKQIKYDNKHCVTYFKIPHNLTQLVKFYLKIELKQSGDVHNYLFEFDAKKEKLYHDGLDKDNVKFVSYTKENGMIRLNEKFLIVDRYKLSVRWNKSGLKYIAFHYD